MKTTYTVHVGPTFPPALKVSPLAAFCLVHQDGLAAEVLVEFIPGKSYGDETAAKKRFESCAEVMNDQTVPLAARHFSLNLLKGSVKEPPLVPDWQSRAVLERDASFSPRGRLDGYW